MTTIINRIRLFFAAVSVQKTMLAEIEALRQDKDALVIKVTNLDIDNQSLSEERADLEQQNIRLQDRLDACLDDRGKLWDLLQETLRGERRAYQMHVNRAWQERGAGIPYPDAPHAESSPVQQESGHLSLSQLPSQRVKARTAEFARDFMSGLTTK